jgi:hypothetical protein
LIPKTLANYGGRYFNVGPVANPQGYVSEAKMNRFLEDVAQMTRTATRAQVHFIPGATDPDVLWHWTIWGSSPSEAPTIDRTGTGLYTVTYPTSLIDALDEEETLSFASVMPTIISANADRAIVSGFTANSVSLKVRNAANALNDLTGVEIVVLWIR